MADEMGELYDLRARVKELEETLDDAQNVIRVQEKRIDNALR